MFHNAGAPSPQGRRWNVTGRGSPNGNQHPAAFNRKAVPATVGVLVALIVSSASAHAAGFDDDPGGKSVVCPAIGCSDGGRECAKASGTVKFWMYIPILPYIMPVEYPFTVTCYEQPAT